MTSQNETEHLRTPFTDLIDLASEAVGGRVLSASDEFFGAKENLLKSATPIFVPDLYTDAGKWMDGWESRRKRKLSPTHNHDWCIIRLGIPGAIQGILVDTAFFLGNYPEFCSVEAAEVSDDALISKNSDEQAWHEILPKIKLQGGIGNLFPILRLKRWTHLRFKIFPDGGVARLRVFGHGKPDWQLLEAMKTPIDFAAASHGAQIISCSDTFFGKKEQLILPGHPKTMKDGWETRRRRGPGHDWIIVKLARPAQLQRLEINTHHFKGNFPEFCSVDALSYLESDLSASDFRDRTDLDWQEILSKTPLQADSQEIFELELLSFSLPPRSASNPVAKTYNNQKITHLRLNIYPDGGISRFRAYGTLEKNPSNDDS